MLNTKDNLATGSSIELNGGDEKEELVGGYKELWPGLCVYACVNSTNHVVTLKLPLQQTLTVSNCHLDSSITRQLSYRKEDRAMRPIWVP